MVLHYSELSGVVLVSIRYAVSQGCLPPLCAFLEDKNDVVIECIVKALNSLLMDADDPSDRAHYAALLEETGGWYSTCVLSDSYFSLHAHLNCSWSQSADGGAFAVAL